MKGLINIKNKDHECFMWCHVRLINPTNSHPERINKQDKKIAANLNCSGIVFPLYFNDYKLMENRFEMNINIFGYENKVYILYVSKKSHTQTLNLLLITEKDKNHTMFLSKMLTDLCFHEQNKDKKHYYKSSLQNFTTEEILSNHKKQCLLINGCQAVNYESGQIKFTNYEKQVPIPFKIYAETECFLKRTN